MEKLTGKCFCGHTSWSADTPILWAALCHCEDCRRAASSDYVSWFGVLKQTVDWKGPRKIYSSSAKVKRSYCKDCGAPLSFETDIFPEETHLYAATLDNPEYYKPEAHIFWSERLPWIQEVDKLPKHEKGLQDAAQKGENLLKPD